MATVSSPFLDALWIASPLVGGPRSSAPAPYLRQEFSLTKPVRSATLHITALGIYDCELNGEAINQDLFLPGWTDYRRRIPFQSHDVTALLKEGENAIGVVLGDGWSCGYISWRSRQNYTDRPMLLAHLKIDFEDGTSLSVKTDETWLTTASPTLENDFLRGEIYDARLVVKDWSRLGADCSCWSPVIVQETPDATLSPALIPPVRRIEEITPVSHRDLSVCWPRTRFYDFGQNFAGRVRIAVKARRGLTLAIRHAEILNPDGTLYTENLRSAIQTDYYTCSGDGVEVWEPKYTYHGFRHIEVTAENAWESLEVTGVVLHSDITPTGHFACSNPLLNQLQHNIVWGQKSNFIEVPTDCPQRDERLGWTGDAQIFTRTACFNFDVREFYKKWLLDIRDSQRENGALPPTAPELFDAPFLELEDGGPAYSDALVISPWIIYLCYADQQVLEDNYDAMRKYMDFIGAHRCKGLIRSHPDVVQWGGFGDWLALDGSNVHDGATAKDLVGTALYAHIADLMSQTAGILGKEDDREYFRTLHLKIAHAFRERFITPNGLAVSATQTAYVLALRFNLVPPELEESVLRELTRHIEGRDYHLATGFVGTPYLMDVLRKYKRFDIAYKLLEQETFPSWIYPIKNGATTIWERWDGWSPEKGFQDKSMNSFNHFSYGSVGDWIYRNVAGLELDPSEPGYRHIIFQPQPGGSITWAEASLETIGGKTSIRWDLQDGRLEVEVVVPDGSRGTLRTPEGFTGEDVALASGTHRITLQQSTETPVDSKDPQPATL